MYFIGQDLFPEFPTATITDVVDFLHGKQEVGLDIETSKKGKYNSTVYQGGLDPYLSRVVMLQIGDLDTRFVIDTRCIDISPILPFFESDILWVGHNLKFEYKHLLHQYKVRLGRVYDTMLAESRLFAGLTNGLSLEDLAYKYNLAEKKQQKTLFDLEEDGFDPDKIQLDKSTRMGFVNIGDRPFTINQVKYGEEDIILPLKIKKLQESNSYFPKSLVALENEFCLVLGDTELNGMSLHQQKWMEIYDDNFKLFQDKQAELDKWLIDRFPQFTRINLFGEKEPTIMWSSPSQVLRLFHEFRMYPEEFSKYKKQVMPSVGKKACQALLTTSLTAEQRKFVKDYLELSELHQAITTYGKDFLKYIHPVTRRIHPNFRQVLNTGRISCTNPNLQSIPGGRHREAFIETDGWENINADYSSQEVVVLANKSGDEAMVDFLLNGDGDLHSFTATQIFSKKNNDPSLLVTKASAEENPEHKEMRKAAKTVNFLIPYGGGPQGLATGLGTEVGEAKEIIDLYFERFPGVKAHFDDCHASWWDKGYIVIDEKTDARFYIPETERLKKIKSKIKALYPPDFWSLPVIERMDIEERIADKVGELNSELKKQKARIDRLSQNYPIQGTSGLITKMAGILIRRKIKEANLWDRLQITLFVHDEINARSKNFSNGPAVVEEAMVKAGSYWCKLVPLKAQAVVADYWKH